MISVDTFPFFLLACMIIIAICCWFSGWSAHKWWIEKQKKENLASTSWAMRPQDTNEDPPPDNPRDGLPTKDMK